MLGWKRPENTLLTPPACRRNSLYLLQAQEFLQEFAWASSDIEANMKRRRQRLTASEEAAAEQSVRC